MNLADLMAARGVKKAPPVTTTLVAEDGTWKVSSARRFESDSPVIHECEQGSPEWHALRAGVPTSSAFDKIVTPGGKKGVPAPSKSAEPYMYRLCAERLLGHAIEDFHGKWMDRGKEFEEEAVNFYEMQRECDTVKVGFITNAAGTIGASPDRLAGDSGLVEIKCPKPETHMGYLLESGSPYEEYKVQCQGQLWIAQREWVDAVSYYPGLPWALGRVERDEAFIAAMAEMIEEFSANLEALYQKCLARGYGRKEPKARPQTISDVMREIMVETQRENL